MPPLPQMMRPALIAWIALAAGSAAGESIPGVGAALPKAAYDAAEITGVPALGLPRIPEPRGPTAIPTGSIAPGRG
jgi:hypothetical protein